MSIIPDSFKKGTDTKDTLEKEDYAWILKVIRESNSLRGSDLPQSVKTVTKLQNLLQEGDKDEIK